MTCPENGVLKEFYRSGGIFEQASYVNGVKHGECICYFLNGATWHHAYYVNGTSIVDLLVNPCDDVALFEIHLIYGGNLL